jgi:hypothetical protein
MISKLNEKAGYPKGKKGAKIAYKESLLKRKKNNNHLIVNIYFFYITILVILKSH